MRKLKYQSTDSGFCRVYFYCKHNKRRYCLQLDTPGVYQLFTCTPYGEPEMPLSIENYTFYKIPREEEIHGEILDFLKSIGK